MGLESHRIGFKGTFWFETSQCLFCLKRGLETALIRSEGSSVGRY
nr:MAG TPA: hypothetical protein [Caudoviricetes sp.]